MTKSKARPIAVLRTFGIAEGISFLVLLIIAMPLKYLYDNPGPVKITGWIHGILFIAYVLMVCKAAFILKWNLRRTALFLAASLVPLATFVLDKNLRQEQQLHK